MHTSALWLKMAVEFFHAPGGMWSSKLHCIVLWKLAINLYYLSYLSHFCWCCSNNFYLWRVVILVMTISISAKWFRRLTTEKDIKQSHWPPLRFPKDQTPSLKPSSWKQIQPNSKTQIIIGFCRETIWYCPSKFALVS